MTKFRTWSLAILSAIVLAGCFGDGSDNDLSDEIAGTVGVVVADARVAGYDKALATITSIELLGENLDPIVLYSGATTIDLLDLRDYQELFSVAGKVPPSRYNAVRLKLEFLELVTVEDNGIETLTQLDLPADGLVTIDFAEPFDVGIAQTAFLSLDFDMAKSLKVSSDKGNTTVEFQPVIFVKPSREGPLLRVARVRGIVDRIDPIRRNFRMCRTERISQVSIVTDTDDLDGCILITSGERTGVFGANGNPNSFDAIKIGEMVSVVGRLTIVPGEGVLAPEVLIVDDPWDSDHVWEYDWASAGSGTVPLVSTPDEVIQDVPDTEQLRFGIAAMVIERGRPGIFEFRDGTIESKMKLSGPGAPLGTFDLTLSPGQGFGTGARSKVTIYPKTWIIGKDRKTLKPFAIQEGRKASINGAINNQAGGRDIRASLLIIENKEGNRNKTGNLQGIIVSIAPGIGQLVIQDDEGKQTSVDASRATVNLRESTGSSFTTREGTLDELSLLQRVTVFGATRPDGVFLAGSIFAQINLNAAP